jgi:hypothetical protein
MGPDQDFQETMVATAEARVGTAGGPGDLHHAEASARKQAAEEDRDPDLAGEECGEGIEEQVASEERGRRGGSGRGDGRGDALIPEQREASAPAKVADRGAGNVPKDHLHPQSIPQADEERLAGRVGHGPGTAQQGNALTGHPGAHEFPVVEVSREEQAGTGLKTGELGGIPGPEGDGILVSPMKEPEEIQGGGLVEAEAEAQGIGDTADPGIVPDPLPLPAYYI